MLLRLVSILYVRLLAAAAFAAAGVSMAYAQHPPCLAELPGKMLEPRQFVPGKAHRLAVARPEAIDCGRAHVVLEAGGAVDSRLACEAVEDAVAFLSGHGLDSGRKVSLTIVEELPSLDRYSVLGQFDMRRGDIRILSLARSLQTCAGNPPFGVPMNSEIHRSFIVHEVIHALTYVGSAEVAPLKMEYVAYVGQFASMSKDVREHLVAVSGAPPFVKDEEISVEAYRADPNRFGIRSWLQFRDAGDGSALLYRALGR